MEPRVMRREVIDQWSAVAVTGPALGDATRLVEVHEVRAGVGEHGTNRDEPGDGAQRLEAELAPRQPNHFGTGAEVDASVPARDARAPWLRYARTRSSTSSSLTVQAGS